jgi:hypothetical protein
MALRRPAGVTGALRGFPIAGFFVAVTSAGMLFLAAMAVVGIWVPVGWWRALALVGGLLSLVLMAVFVGPTKLLPIALDLFVVWAVAANWPLATNPGET